MVDGEGSASSADRPAAARAEGGGLVGAPYLEAMLPFLTEGVYIYDREGNLKARLTPPGGLLGYDASVGTNLFTHLHPDDVPRGIQIGAEAHEAQLGWVGEVTVRLRHADGSWRLFELRIHNRYGDPAIDGMVATMREISPPLGTVEGELDGGSFADDLPTAYLALGHRGRIRFASEAATELLACTREELIGLPIGELVVDVDRPLVLAAYAALMRSPGARTVVATTRPRYGSRVVEGEFHTRGTDSENKLVTVVLVDHSEEPELVRLATHDALTGLANRTVVLETITGLLVEPNPVLAVVYVDLDDLKRINDTHGHEAGDCALIEVAHRLESMVRPGDVVGRMSGDEFVVVCPGMEGVGLMGFVQRLGESGAHGNPVPTPDGSDIDITVSAGGATATAGDTTASLLRRADEAMFASKHERGTDTDLSG